jgi:hypothetical protein
METHSCRRGCLPAAADAETDELDLTDNAKREEPVREVVRRAAGDWAMVVKMVGEIAF